ncbi:MAG: uracil-DNA glycosylase [Aggregatilineales bacterium]
MTDRAAALEAIAQRIRACTLCSLHQGATNPVPGAGNIHADIVFIGEGPGFHEDRQGLPFVGRSGEYLNYLLSLIGLRREQVFITNVVKHRPPDNRDPLPEEISACKPYLDEQLALIDPAVIVTLGRFSMARYFPGGKISQIHGQPRYDTHCAYYPLFHPAAALRTPALRRDMEADIRRLPEIVAKVKAMRAAAPSQPPAPNAPAEPPKQLPLF